MTQSAAQTSIENQLLNRSEMPVITRHDRNTPNQAQIVNALSVGKKKNRLGEALNGTRFTNRGTGKSPRSPSIDIDTFQKKQVSSLSPSFVR